MTQPQTFHYLHVAIWSLSLSAAALGQGRIINLPSEAYGPNLSVNADDVVNVFDGGAISDFFQASQLNVHGGTVGDHLQFNASASNYLSILDGEVGENAVVFGGRVTVHGGQIGDLFQQYDGSFLMTGGKIGQEAFFDGVPVVITGGEIGSVSTPSSDVSIRDGEIGFAESRNVFQEGGNITSASVSNYMRLNGGRVSEVSMVGSDFLTVFDFYGGDYGSVWLPTAEGHFLESPSNPSGQIVVGAGHDTSLDAPFSRGGQAHIYSAGHENFIVFHDGELHLYGRDFRLNGLGVTPTNPGDVMEIGLDSGANSLSVEFGSGEIREIVIEDFAGVCQSFLGADCSSVDEASIENDPRFPGGLSVASNDARIFLHRIDEIDGDYNFDGRVDAADYTVWRDTDGTEIGYDIWASSFGGVWQPPRMITEAIAIPEPNAAWLFASVASVWFCTGGLVARS